MLDWNRAAISTSLSSRKSLRIQEILAKFGLKRVDIEPNETFIENLIRDGNMDVELIELEDALLVLHARTST